MQALKEVQEVQLQQSKSESDKEARDVVSERMQESLDNLLTEIGELRDECTPLVEKQKSLAAEVSAAQEREKAAKKQVCSLLTSSASASLKI